MTKPRIEEIDHSGDVGIAVEAQSLNELFEGAALGLFALMASGKVEARVERAVRAQAQDTDALLVDWLNEIIRMAATCGERYTSVAVHHVSETEAAGVLRGETVDPGRHALRFDVKAATYHGLTVESLDGEIRARVIFDL